jgi:hypothetical protein
MSTLSFQVSLGLLIVPLQQVLRTKILYTCPRLTTKNDNDISTTTSSSSTSSSTGGGGGTSLLWKPPRCVNY